MSGRLLYMANDPYGKHSFTVSRVERVARYCGPAVVSKLFGITREDAAHRLLQRCPWSRGGITAESMRHVLGVRRDSSRYVWFRKNGKRPTLARWLREDGRDAVLWTTEHFVLVIGGEVVEDNGEPTRRGRVRGFILLRGLHT